MNPLTMLAPEGGNLRDLIDKPVVVPFAKETMTFLQDLSQMLLKGPKYQAHSELVALGFWLRASHLNHLASELNGINKPLGTVVHFTPSNVDTMFVYSWVCSLLMGNRNVIRVSSRHSEVKQHLLESINKLFQKADHRSLAQRNFFVSFDKHSDGSAQLSALADARVIWGGDDTVSQIRGLPVSPRCRDISFADRYSCALINGEALGADDLAEVAQRMWRDTQPFQQQACSSPRVILWLGDQARLTMFLQHLNDLARPSQQVNQLNEHLVTTQVLMNKQYVSSPIVQSAICALPVDKIDDEMFAYHQGVGLYLVLSLQTLGELVEHVAAKCQTLAYWGIEKTELLKLIQHPSIMGIDRVVPLGTALDFDVSWDGYVLLEQLSRRVAIK